MQRFRAIVTVSSLIMLLTIFFFSNNLCHSEIIMGKYGDEWVDIFKYL